MADQKGLGVSKSLTQTIAYSGPLKYRPEVGGRVGNRRRPAPQEPRREVTGVVRVQEREELVGQHHRVGCVDDHLKLAFGGVGVCELSGV